jgi:hypothetical protein
MIPEKKENREFEIGPDVSAENITPPEIERSEPKIPVPIIEEKKPEVVEEEIIEIDKDPVKMVQKATKTPSWLDKLHAHLVKLRKKNEL